MKAGATPVRLDHVHVGVRDRRPAAAWYRRVLGLRVTYDYTLHGDHQGPLVLPTPMAIAWDLRPTLTTPSLEP